MCLDIIHKYYNKESELYKILISHSECVCMKAIEIAEQNTNLNADIQFIREATMLHDIGIFLTNAPRIHCLGEHNYMEHGYLGAEILRKEGLPKHALVCERHTGTGLTTDTIIANGWNIPHIDMVPESIEEQIICYADLFFSKTRLNKEHKLGYIRKKVAEYGTDNIAIFDNWSKIFKTI